MSLIDYAENGTILCFGDSLTHGMYVTADGEWRKTHSYTIKLAELIKNSKIVEMGIGYSFLMTYHYKLEYKLS